MPRVEPQVRVTVSFTHTRRFPTATRVICLPTVANVTLAAESALKELIERVPSVRIPERNDDHEDVRHWRQMLRRSFAMCMMALTLAGCATGLPDVQGPPLPRYFAVAQARQGADSESEPVGYTLRTATVSTNLLGHVEFRFKTQSVWQGWDIQQSNDGLVWQTFASTTVTNGDWQSTNFMVVNGSPGIYPTRTFRLLRTR